MTVGVVVCCRLRPVVSVAGCCCPRFDAGVCSAVEAGAGAGFSRTGVSFTSGSLEPFSADVAAGAGAAAAVCC